MDLTLNNKTHYYNKLHNRQYVDILAKDLNSEYHKNKYKNIEEAARGPLNPNLPVYKQEHKIVVNNKDINVFKPFWNYKAPAAQTFTNYESAGVNSIKEDLSVRDLPLSGMNRSTPDLVLSNTNNIRNNLQNYGNMYLENTNHLNKISNNNGVYYEESSVSPYRSGTGWGKNINETSNNLENGDLYTKTNKELRVDLPLNYGNNSVSSWQHVNPICIIPSENKLLPMNERLKYGLFALDSMKYIGRECLTADFNITPEKYDAPVDVFSGCYKFPPITNPDYYVNGDKFHKRNGQSFGLYCSKNTNFVAMPKNYYHSNLDTSFNVSPGNNSVTNGVIMSSALRNFINNELYNFNKVQVLKAIYLQEQSKNSNLIKYLTNKYPVLLRKNISEYNKKSEKDKYLEISNDQKTLSELYTSNTSLQEFILSLNIVKFGGSEEGKGRGAVSIDSQLYLIENPGVFLLLPSMLSKDLFNLQM